MSDLFAVSKLPEGYEVRTVSNRHDGSDIKIVPYFRGKPIGEGRDSFWGFGSAVRSARRAIRVHYRYNVDKSQEIR